MGPQRLRNDQNSPTIKFKMGVGQTFSISKSLRLSRGLIDFTAILHVVQYGTADTTQ